MKMLIMFSMHFTVTKMIVKMMLIVLKLIVFLSKQMLLMMGITKIKIRRLTLMKMITHLFELVSFLFGTKVSIIF